MDAKEILNPQRLMIAVGVLVIVVSFWGIMNGDKWAEYGWGEENVLAHDADYEKMWALHMMPLGVMAIGTGIFVKGRALAQMAMAAAVSIAVFIGGGMLYLTNESGYGSDQSGMIYVMLFLTALIGASGYLNKDDE